MTIILKLTLCCHWLRDCLFPFHPTHTYCSVITVIEYTKNNSNLASLDIDDVIQYIVDTIDSNKDVFQDVFSVKGIKSGTVTPICDQYL